MQESADPESAPEPVKAPTDDDLDRFDEDLASVAAALEALDADDLETAETLTASLSAPLGDLNDATDQGGGAGESSAVHDPASDGTGDDHD